MTIPRPRASGPIPLRLPLFAAAAGDLLFKATRLLIGSVNLNVFGRDQLLAARQQGRPLVFVGWHEHDLINLGAYRPVLGREARGAIIVRDDFGGLTLVRLARRMNIAVVSLGHDPESAYWARGVVSMIELTRAGYDALLAVDGPEGPAHRAKLGAALIAQRSGALLVPCAVAARPAFRLRNRWDEHLIPLPSSRVTIHMGPLIDARPPEGPQPEIEELRQRIEESLVAGTRRAEALCRWRSR